MSLSRQDPRLGPSAVCAAAIGFGLGPYFAVRVLDSGVTALSVSALRVAILMVVLLPVAPKLRGWPKEAVLAAVGGAISTVGLAGFFLALERAPVASVTVVYYTYPVAVLALSALLWRRRLTRLEVIAGAAVIAGVALAVGPLGLSSSGVVALAPAVAAPVGWAIYLIILSGPVAAMPTLPKVFAGSCGGVVVLLPLALWQSEGALMPLTADVVTSMALLVVCTLAIPATRRPHRRTHGGIDWCARVRRCCRRRLAPHGRGTATDEIVGCLAGTHRSPLVRCS